MQEKQSPNNQRWLVGLMIPIALTMVGAAVGYGITKERVDTTKQELITHCVNQEREMGIWKQDLKELSKAVSELTTEVKVLNTEMRVRRGGSN